MTRPWKPKPPEVSWQSVGKRDNHACDCCGQKPKSMRCVVTVQTNWFRGDDEVEIWCMFCAIHKGISPHNLVCRIFFNAMTDAERDIIIKRLIVEP